MDTPASVAVLAHLQCRTDLHTEAAGPINTEHTYIYTYINKNIVVQILILRQRDL